MLHLYGLSAIVQTSELFLFSTEILCKQSKEDLLATLCYNVITTIVAIVLLITLGRPAAATTLLGGLIEILPEFSLSISTLVSWVFVAHDFAVTFFGLLTLARLLVPFFLSRGPSLSDDVIYNAYIYSLITTLLVCPVICLLPIPRTHLLVFPFFRVFVSMLTLYSKFLNGEFLSMLSSCDRWFLLYLALTPVWAFHFIIQVYFDFVEYRMGLRSHPKHPPNISTSALN
jgi:hypothetical protein